MVARMQNVEKNLDVLCEKMCQEYDTPVTLVAQGWTDSRQEDMVAEAKTLVQQVLNEPDVPVVRAIHLPSHTNNPGLVKIEVDSLQSKIKLLKKKRMLGDTDSYKKHLPAQFQDPCREIAGN